MAMLCIPTVGGRQYFLFPVPAPAELELHATVVPGGQMDEAVCESILRVCEIYGTQLLTDGMQHYTVVDQQLAVCDPGVHRSQIPYLVN